MRFLKILFIYLLILFPFGELLRFDIGNNIAWKPLDAVIFFIVTIGIIIQRNKLKKYIRLQYLLFPLIGLVSLLLNLSWLKQNEILPSFFYLARWVLYLGLFVVFKEFPTEFKKKLQLFLFIDGALILVFGFIQYVFFNDLRYFYYLGWDPHLHRIFSTFLDPNFTGGFFVLYFIFTMGMIVEYKNNKSFIKNKNIVLLGGGLVLFLTLSAILLTFSRAAILMLLVSSITFFILIGKKKLIAMLLIDVTVFAIVVSPKFYDENMNLFRIASSKARIFNYSVALKIIEDRPLLGVGFNSYRYTKRLYNLDHDWVVGPSHADAGVDNSFLFVLATTGIVGFSAYAYLWYMIFREAFQLYKKNKNIMAIVVIASSMGLFIHALFINSLFFGPFMLWMWFLIGFLKND